MIGKSEHTCGTIAVDDPNPADPCVLLGVITGANSPGMLSIAIDCPHCARSKRRPYRHYHGWPADKDHNHAEHRISHCWRGPLEGTGIWISVFPPDHPRAAEHVFPPGRVLTPEEFVRWERGRR